MSEWIRCKDRMPEEDKSVLLTNGKCVLMGAYGRHDDTPLGNSLPWQFNILGFYGYNLGIDGDSGPFAATHWMPLPEPPK